MNDTKPLIQVRDLSVQYGIGENSVRAVREVDLEIPRGEIIGIAGGPPKAVGFVRGSMTFICSMIEPGQPCVIIIGRAFSCLERTWMK